MKKIGKMYVRNEDQFIRQYFERTGDKFEIDHLEKAMTYVTDFSVAIDGGAQYGSWTRYLAQWFDLVYAVEPVEATYECLVENVQHLENVRIVPAALGERIGFVNVGEGKMFTHPGMETIIGEGDIPRLAIDDMDLPSLGLLKLDIEGYELFALKGAEKTLRKFHPIVIFELNIRGKLEHNVKYEECGDFLESLGATHLTTINKDLVYGWL